MSQTKLLVISQISFAALLSMLASADSQTIKDYSASGPAQAAAPAPTIDQRLKVVEQKTSYYQTKSVKKSYTYDENRGGFICGADFTGGEYPMCTLFIHTDVDPHPDPNFSRYGDFYLWIDGIFNFTNNIKINHEIRFEIFSQGGHKCSHVFKNFAGSSKIVLPQRFCIIKSRAAQSDMGVKITFSEQDSPKDIEKYLGTANINVGLRFVEIFPPQ